MLDKYPFVLLLILLLFYVTNNDQQIQPCCPWNIVVRLGAWFIWFLQMAVSRAYCWY